jgi:hypothetical protein
MSLTEQQEAALRELLGQRTPAEWDPPARRLARALQDGQVPELTPTEYDTLLAAVIRLRLREALSRALEAGAISSSAAAQILGFVGHHQETVALEDLLDPVKFPNLLGSPDFAYLRVIKAGLREDLQKLKSAADRK